MRSLSAVFGFLALAALTVAATAPPLPAPPSDASPKAVSPTIVTLQGHLIDTKCYGMGVNMEKPKMNYNNTHMVPGKDGTMQEVPNCASACANMGIPVGLVEGSTPGNKTYVLITPSTQLAEHMDKEARVSGELAFSGGVIPSKVEVKENGEWTEVEIATMM